MHVHTFCYGSTTSILILKLTSESHFAHAGLYTSLTQKYREYLDQSQSVVEPVRETLAELQMAYTEQRLDPHPKLTEMTNIVRHWKKSLRKSSREKVNT